MPKPNGKCPQCGEPRLAREANASFPFCCHRCKLIDLGRWLDGEYRIPVGAGITERSGPTSDELEAARADREIN